ncbi:MAG: lipopolysaccharide biosynthesis protein [Muribaculaceae bacterium]|nr:lipopolysaccharide biosynthesis protein [Muribaculaceae bacterium]
MTAKDDKTTRSKHFIKSIGIYAVGNIGSKIITFVMVPLYTFFIDTESFGYYDVCMQMCFLLMSFVTLQLRDGSFRFLLDTDSKPRRRQIITFVYRTLVVNICIVALIALLLSFVVEIRYMWLTVGLLASLSLQEVISQVYRVIGSSKAFVVTGLLSASLILLLSLLFIVVMGMGVEGVYLANILARLLALIIVELRLKIIYRYIRPSLKVKTVGRELLRFSLPLIPGAFCWWFVFSSDRFFIINYLDLNVNGIYAVATRFASILLTLSTIFQQAWQETAILQYKSADRDSFFTRIFNFYIYLLSIAFIVYALGLKAVYGYIVDPRYSESLLYVYPTGLTTILFGIVLFFEMGYQVANDTKRAVLPIVMSIVLNLVLNFVLVQLWGIVGILITAITTAVFLVIFRWFHMRKYFTLKIFAHTYVPMLCVLLTALPFYYVSDIWLNIVCGIALLAVVVLTMPRELSAELKQKLGQKFSHEA